MFSLSTVDEYAHYGCGLIAMKFQTMRYLPKALCNHQTAVSGLVFCFAHPFTMNHGFEYLNGWDSYAAKLAHSSYTSNIV